jgi:ParB family chromosome partitioning protein
MKGTLKYIEVSHIHPHPDNPRKDLGDLTELAASIAQSGVMQNLTIVPHKDIEDDYTVVIGHRRLGASKLAGLTFVPCIVVEDMTEKEQLATMMLENMQRTDLTVYEQAQGFQLMMDLGETVETIAEKTGISKSTVRNRMKLAKYDREIMREAATRQPTMEQYMKLCRIEDIDVANNVARFLGTKNFDYNVDKAIREQEEKKSRAELKVIISELATHSTMDWHEREKKGLVECMSFYPPLTADKLRAELNNLIAKHGKLWYSEGYGFTIYRKSTKEDAARVADMEAKQAARRDLEHRAKAMQEALEDRIEAFLVDYRPMKEHREDIIRGLFEASVRGYLRRGNVNVAADFGFKLPEGVNTWGKQAPALSIEYLMERYTDDPYAVIPLYIYLDMPCGEICTLYYNDKQLQTRDNEPFVWLLGFLAEIGYNVADEEWAFVNGTHPIYNEVLEGL